jgi:hypothetical protein
MPSRDQLKEEISTLVEKGLTLWRALMPEESKKQKSEKGDAKAVEKAKPIFSIDYQHWYTRALRVVESLARDRLVEFRGFYEPDPKRKELGYGTYVIQDYIKGVAPNSFRFPDFDTDAQAARAVFNQVAILGSLNSRVDSVIASIEAHLLADLQDLELRAARELMSVSPRAAGALAGVVLEGYLLRVAQARQIKVAKGSPTIGDLNELLRQADAYDLPSWRKISYLADIRNMCAHRKSAEPTVDQVRELIEGANWALKNIN